MRVARGWCSGLDCYLIFFVWLRAGIQELGIGMAKNDTELYLKSWNEGIWANERERVIRLG